MSNENEFVASVNRLESLIDSNQQDLKRDVESLIDRRFSSLKEEVNKLKCAQSALDQINNLMALWDDRHELSDLPNRIRAIIEGVTANNNQQSHHLDTSEVGDNVTVEPTNNLGENELGTEGHVNSLDTNVPSTLTVNDHNLNSSTSDNEQVNGHSPNHEPSEPLATSSSIIDTNIQTEDASNSQQSVQMCKRVKMDEDGQYITDSDSDSDCDCDECIYGIVKQELNEELVETCQLDPDNGQSVQIWTQVKKEEETSDDENVTGHRVELQMAPEGGEDPNDNRQESLPEKSNGTNQSSVNDQSIDQQVDDHEPSQSISTTTQSSSTSKQSKTRKRKRAGKSQVTENSSFENSLTSGEVSTYGQITKSKRTRVSSSLDRNENADQMNTQSKGDLRDGDDPNGKDSSGEEQVEQSEDEERWWDCETELGEEDEGGHYKIEIVKLKCTEDGCEDEVADTDKLHDHLRVKHRMSPHRCLAVGCNERFEQWIELGPHVQNNHSNISTWSCPHCTKTFKFQNHLYKHLHMYHFEGQFKYGYDGCHFDRVATFRIEIGNHQKSVHPKSTIFTCQFPNCGKSFIHKGHFNRHQKSHSGVKAFRCEWTGCEKSFTQKSHLNDHQRIHQKVKPFKCTWDTCDFAATHQSDVIKHIRIKHFHLPRSQKKQRELGIEDNRNPRDFVQHEHNSPI